MNEYPSVVRVLSSIVVHGHTLDSSTRTSDSALTRQICYGVLRNYYQLNALVKLLLDKPLPRKHLDLHLLLLAGIYSVLYLDRSFQSSVNIAVEATTDLKKTWAKKLVNGVLRQFLRKKSELLVEIESEPEASSNHPKWLYDRIHSAYPNHADDIIEANNTHPPMTLRVNLLQIERSNYQLLLDENGMQSSKGRMADSSLYLKDPVSVDRLPGFDEGMVSIQDEASQLAASLISLSPGHRVLDACAAPGGKTCHMLETEPGISLTALDIDSGRLTRIQQNLDRLKLKSNLVHSDLMSYQPAELFDRILLDAPCSATGIIRRHPDIKLLRRDTDIDKLASTQLGLLAKAWSLLKHNGELLYSTCSILPAENGQVINSFKQQNASVVVQPIDASWGIHTDGGQQILPTTTAADGFFYASLRKRA